jgi:photosystem II stability/assembly factor-like uncharacterized protein
MEKGLWKNTYAATNAGEYWAECVQSYFDCNNPPNKGVHNDINTREKLEKYDPEIFQLIDEVFKKSKFRYVRYDKRNPPKADGQPGAGKLTAELVRGLELRGIGPAFRPGRIADVVVDPRNRKVWYVATASSGLWKTTDAGTTWTPIFDRYVSYSFGCLALDPKNPDIVWLGTGENQSQRSVGFGDGVYRSNDGGQSWKAMGLRDSEHIGKILIDPRNTNVVYVAAQGPLWAPGGDRGLYKSTNGGDTWKPILQISENTGITDIVFDPRNPDVIYAAAYQRRRHTGMLIGGGPEAGIFKSVNGGEKWTKLTKGLPTVDLGRIALGISPQNPDIVYALVIAAKGESGFFRSEDRGDTWVKQSGHKVADPQYYGEIYPDPHKFDRVYAVDINTSVTNDGGKTFTRAGWKMHSDHHSITFDPNDPDHLLVGNDGGLYETKDGGKNWRHFTNLSTAQYYRVAVDNALPFYNVYGGTQDNGSHGGPSRTLNRTGITNSDWRGVGGGDGMQPRVDPENPSIIYTMSQNGAIVRLEGGGMAGMGGKGGGKPIRPKAAKGTVRWNWDTPFIISPHAPKRLYLAGSVLYRSDDRGDNWTAISPDLTRQLDRNKIPVMGKLWGPDAVTRNLYTTDLGVASALSESPVQEGLIVVGTDDGLVQVTENGGKDWRKVDAFPGVPELSYVSDVFASPHDASTVFASFNNWQRGDFKPYLLRSTDRGKTWTSIAGNLPDRNPVWCIVQDHGNKDLLFAGTEFGLYFSIDGGKQWVQLRGGVPPIPFRDLEIQRRETDLVCATFGRGFYILDDYTALRHLTPDTLAKEGTVFPLRKVYRYELKDAPAGTFAAPNPPSGAVFTCYLRDGLKSDTKVVLTVTDASGKTLRQIDGPTKAGLHRINWDLRPGSGEMVAPGTYRVALAKLVGGNVTPLGEAQTFEVVPLPSKGAK